MNQPGSTGLMPVDAVSSAFDMSLKAVVDATFVQFASGVVLGIDAGDLVSVWLDPVFAG
ncbi:hypothetical protein [Streptomyces sp. Rer75]|uniref:hypothetical protein n=1 Tax=Streptomyces sp. Rer75 TaxID=2750011 RepID=UPI0015D0AEEC|nr:hypothetical protein [Streptomyces sp. Rer75]QLH25162.1 hypothetical protein HYQ63_34725 [Streptomyces sp. Rer75]